jgi:hypothetical protein
MGRELDNMTREIRKASKMTQNLRMQLANAPSLATWAAPQAPPQCEDRGQKFPNSPDISRSDQTQLEGWIVQLQMIIQHKPTSFPNEQSKMQYAFDSLSRIPLRKNLPHVQENGEIGWKVYQLFYNSWKQHLGTPTKWQLDNNISK